MMSFKRTLSLILSISLLCISFGQTQAAIITNDQIIQQSQQKTDKTALLQMINRSDIQERLLDMGVTSADVEERINQMTPEEVAQLNQQLDQLPAGSGIIGIIALGFVVFVITDVIGATDIFPFIHPVK
ncbi:MAG: PA2779 family protein [Gammaproteobacteria bacterium]|nr:PA2779 family protein [Gammaproteobacteria bacterium]